MARAMAPAAYPRVALRQRLAPSQRERVLSNALDEPGRLSPPIWPCTTRGFPCLVCHHTSGGLLPHLFTLTREPSNSKTSRRFSCAMPPCRFAGGIFSVALSVNEPAGVNRSSRCANRSPGVTRRVALIPDWLRTVSGLSSRPAIFRWPSQRSPGPPAASIV